MTARLSAVLLRVVFSYAASSVAQEDCGGSDRKRQSIDASNGVDCAAFSQQRPWQRRLGAVAILPLFDPAQ